MLDFLNSINPLFVVPLAFLILFLFVYGPTFLFAKLLSLLGRTKEKQEAIMEFVLGAIMVAGFIFIISLYFI